MGSGTASAKLLQSRTVGGKLTGCALCPHTDLVAAVADGKAVSMHRFTWQRLSVVVPSSGGEDRISSVAWAAKDASVVVALTGGRLLLYAAERSAKDAALAEVTLLNSPPTSLACGVLPRPKTQDSEHWAEAYKIRPCPTDSKIQDTEQDQGDSDIVVAGDADGHVSLYTCGMRIALTRTPALPGGISVTRTALLGNAVVVLGSKDGLLHAAALPLNALQQAQPELRRAGSEAVLLCALRDTLHERIQHARKRWVECVDEALTKSLAEPLDEALTAARAGISAWDVLCDTHHSAALHPAAATVLAEHVGEGGARETLRGFRGACDDIEDAMASACRAAQALTFRTAEYAAVASAAHVRFAAIGIHADEIEHGVQYAGKLLEDLTVLLADVYALGTRIEAFLEWVVILAQKADKDPKDAARIPPLAEGKSILVTDFFHSRDEPDAVLAAFDLEIQAKVTELGNVVDKIVKAHFDKVSGMLQRKQALRIAVTDDVDLGNASIVELSNSIRVMFVDKNGRLVMLRYEAKYERWRGCWAEIDLNQEKLLCCTHWNDRLLCVSVSNDSVRLYLSQPWNDEDVQWIDLTECESIESEPVTLPKMKELHETPLSKLPTKAAITVRDDKVR